jgi:hypothetical protein
MFGDLLASQTCGPLYATLRPSGQQVLLVRGQPLPASVRSNPGGASFNFDTVNQSTGQTIPAGTTLSQSRIVNGFPGVVPPASCPGGLVALVARGAFKIADNESPRPQDRVFAFYNYFNDVNPSATRTAGLGQTDVHREVAGFEKTFLDGDASIGLRAPVVQVAADPSIDHQGFGDLSVVFKYALLNDRQTGNVFSLGMVVTLPTGANFLPVGTPDIHDTLLQPYVGGIVQFGNFYLLGFSSIVVPTDARDVTFLANDLGIGYNAYSNCGAFVSSITPTIEGHLTTPLTHRGSDTDPIGLPDIFDVTCAVRIGICDRASLGLGVVVPLTGPKPFDIEAQVQFNVRF